MIELDNITQKSEQRFVPLIVGAGVTLGALFHGLVWSANGVGINLVLVQAVFVAVVFWLSRRTGHGLPREAWVPAGFSLAFAGAFAVWASPLALAVAAVGFLVSQAVLILYAIGHHMDFHHPVLFLHSAFFLMPVHALMRSSIFGQLPLPRRAPANTRAIVVGLCALIPILALFGALFMSADPLFEGYVNDLFDFISFPNGFRHVIGTVFWSFAFGAVLALAFWKRSAFGLHARPEPKWHTESTIILGGVIALFTVFIVVQAAYLFGGEAAFQASDFTFSEYARRGFNELVAVATIVLFLFLSLRYLHGDRASRILAVLHGVLFAETLLILFSAIQRMNLYVDAYGYTAARLFTYWFLAAVAALIVLAFVHLLRSEDQPKFIRQGLVLVGTFALGFIISSPDAMAFRLNAPNIVSAGEIQLADVLSSSADAYPTLVELERAGVQLIFPENVGRDTIRNASYNFYPDMNNDWRKWNWSKSRLDRSQLFPWLGCITPECDFFAQD